MKTKPFAVTGSRVLVDRDQVGGAALGHRAERLLEDRGEPAGLVAGRRVVVHLVAVARGVVLPPADPLDQLLADFACVTARRVSRCSAP